MINQKVPVHVTQGTNNYEIKVTDKAGNTATKIMSIDWDTDANNDYNDLQDQIDDLQNQIENQ
jgi:uncharacterized protein YpuA (DUF1002 family)